jgi:hypothetical protein
MGRQPRLRVRRWLGSHEFATTTPLFTIAFQGSSGAATVGLNARNLEALGAAPPGRVWTPPGPDFSAHVTLDPLNQPAVGNRGHFIAKIAATSTRPQRPSGSSYTVEFRHRAGWDQAIGRDVVLVHEVRSNTLSFLQPSGGASFLAGGQFVTPDPPAYIRVSAINAAPPTATVRIWDLPEGCLRKEDSKPHVYLIENRTKRHITSPQVLAALGRGWADVRSVPDGGLDPIPVGPPVNILTVSIQPYPVPIGQAVTTTLTATDLGTGAAIAGDVLVNGQVVGSTNTPFQYTFRVQRRRIRNPEDGRWEIEIIPPTCEVRAAGYPDTEVDLGL